MLLSLAGPVLYRNAALAVLYVHFAIVVFNVFWLVAVPIGAWQGWVFVRNLWWRLIHIATMLIVAAQAVAGRYCFLTLMQNYLQGRAGEAAEPPSLLTRVVELAIYWPLPDWVFAPLYVLALLYAAVLWITVPPIRPKRLKPL